jgi:uncharacterized protein (TIGR03437 family)
MNGILFVLSALAAVSLPALGQGNGYATATVAGGANPYYYSGLGDGGPAISAALGKPAYDVASDTAGNLYIAAGGLIRKVTPDGKISRIAGGGSEVGDFVPATQAALFPTAVVADSAGNLLIADTAFGVSRIRMVDANGIITTLAGGAPCCDPGDGGPATGAYIGVPYGLALDAAGALYIAQAGAQNNLIRKVARAQITTVAGGGRSSGDGASATAVSLARPLGVAVDTKGNLYIAETGANQIRQVSAAGMITTIAGTGEAGTSGDGGAATRAAVNAPYHVALDAAGDIFVTQIDAGRVRVVTPGGTIASAGATLEHPAGIAPGNCGQIYVADASATAPAVRVLNRAPEIAPGGVVPAGSSATAIEAGSWFSIYGSDLAGCTAVWNGNFPTSLGGTSVTVDSKPAYLWFVSPTQINAQAPDDLTSGAVGVRVTTAGGGASSNVNLVPYAPAFSLFNSRYPAAIVSTATGYDAIGPAGALAFPTRPVKAGETVSLFGVGFGPTNPPVPAGKGFAGAAPCATLPQVTIGGMPATVSFAGIVGAGLYQLNVVVPSAGSGDVPLRATAGDSSTQSNVFLTLQ